MRTVVGFIAPLAADAEQHRLDLNAAVGAGHPGRYVVELDGQAALPVALGAGDLAIVDCSRTPVRGALVVAEEDGRLALRVLARPPRPADPPVFGVVTHVVARVAPPSG